MKHLWTLSFTLCLLSWFSSAAQQSGVTIQPSKTRINASNEELVNVVVRIHNHRTDILNGTFSIVTPEELQLVSKRAQHVQLAAGDSTFISVKLFITRKAHAGKEHSVRLVLHNGDQPIAENHIRISVAIKKDVSLTGLHPDMMLESITDSLSIPVRITNSGNSMQRVNVLAQYPGRSGESQTVELNIGAYRDTVIRFRKAVDRQLLDPSGTRITIIGMYQSGEIFGMAYTRIQSARNMRNYNAESLLSRYDDNNAISIGVQNLANRNEAYLFTGRGAVAMPGGALRFNLDATAWKNSTYSPAMVRNTWVDVKNRNIGIRAGNISRNIELNLTGRGVSASFNDTARNNVYEAGYISANPNLVGTYYGFFPAGEAAWGSVRHQEKKWQLQSSAVYETNPLLNARNYLLSNEFALLSFKDIKVTTAFNVSHQQALRLTDASKFGFATGLAANGKAGKLHFTSSNFYSTAHYAGLRKGAFVLSNRATWFGDVSTLWGSFNYHNYKPGSLHQVFLPHYGYLRAEAGLSKKPFKGLTISAGPRFTSEKNNAYQVPGTGDRMSLNAWGLTGSINYALSETQFLSAEFESGLYQVMPGNNTQLHMRSVINYQHRIFRLNTIYQAGNFYLGDVANNALTGDKKSRMINITPTFNHSFFRNRTQVSAGISYMYNSMSGTNALLTGRIDQQIGAAAILFAGINHNRYKYHDGLYNYNMIEAGITQKFGRIKVGMRDHTLSVTLFNDHNRNNEFDEGDTYATDQTVYVNEALFTTRNDGTVTYKNLPTGDYRISIPGRNGWHAPEQTIVVSKKTKILIPLHRTGIVKGRIIYNAGEFSYEILRNLAGITIHATHENGKTYTTRTNIDGAYIFYMPAGRYTLVIDKESLQPEVEPGFDSRTVTVDPQHIQNLDLELKVKTRRLETKKFTSPGLKK